MRKLTYEERRQIYIDYKDIPHKIYAHTFEDALDACKQKVCENYKKERRDYKRLQRRISEKQRAYDRNYSRKVLSGEINPPSAKRTRQFVHAVIKKYGSLQAGYAYNKAKKMLKRYGVKEYE